MDYRGFAFGGDGNLYIVLAVAGIWLMAFVFVRTRKALTGRDGNAGTITFSIVINMIMGLFLAAAAFVPAWFVSSMVVIGYSSATGQTPQDLVALHWWLLVVCFILAGTSIVWWLRRP